MRYLLNRSLFKKRLIEAGYKGLFDFSVKSSVHRNTIQNFLSGKDVFPVSFIKIAKYLNTDPLELLTAESGTKAKIGELDEIRPVIATIVKYNKKIGVVLLGSRAKGNAKKYSDWDIGVTCGGKPLSAEEFLKLKNIVEEASENIPRIVQLIDLDSAPSWFLKDINYEPIFLDGDQEAIIFFKGVLNGVKKEGQA